MSMKSTSAPRTVYSREGLPLVMVGGCYFAPRKSSEIVTTKTVRTAPLPRRDGKARIQVTQGLGENAIVENWTEKKVVFKKRA